MPSSEYSVHSAAETYQARRDARGGRPNGQRSGIPETTRRARSGKQAIRSELIAITDYRPIRARDGNQLR